MTFFQNHQELKEGLQKVKKSFKHVVFYYNDEGKDLLDEQGKKSFKELYNIWFKIKSLNDKYEKIFEIKQHHHYINGSVFDECSNHLWRNYIEECMDFRIGLNIFVHTKILKPCHNPITGEKYFYNTITNEYIEQK